MTLFCFNNKSIKFIFFRSQTNFTVIVSKMRVLGEICFGLKAKIVIKSQLHNDIYIYWKKYIFKHLKCIFKLKKLKILYIYINIM